MFRKTKFSKSYLLVIIIIGCILTACRTESAAESENAVVHSEPVEVPRATEEATPEPSVQQITLLAAGDNLIHMEVIESGLEKGRKYNYDHLFSELKERIEAADIAVINQETILGGEELGYSGYPTFNSPVQIGDAVADAGFDVVLHGSNHAMDKGKQGIIHTLKFWKKYPDIAVLGIHLSKKEQDEITVIEKNGIRIAVINASYGLNGITLSRENSYLVDLLEENRLKVQIKKARKAADAVVVFPHWGTEYMYEPDQVQKKWTEFFAQQGVDLVIGTHPHTIQPAEWIDGAGGKRMLVYYSLGNYISYQKKAPRMLGALAEITFTKTGQSTTITEAFATPIVTHYEQPDDYNFATYLLSDYTRELAVKHGVIEKEENSRFTLDYMKELASQVLGDWNSTAIK